jgi:excisionase family DNA binding protein
MKTTLDVNELKTVAEVTSWLQIKPMWIYQRICAGNLPFPYIKLGNHLRFPAEGIRRWLESQTREGGAA